MKTPPVRRAWLLPLCVALAPAAPVTGWLSWRGPDQNLTSRETGLPATLAVGGPGQLWTADFPGQSTPVVANGRLYVMGYLGEGADLQEGVACFDAGTGRKLWQRLFNDYLSDTVYLRYATSSPAIDGETGNVYVQGTQGMFGCFDADGKLLWQHSLMEGYGRLTFPNARTASPVIDHDLVITRDIDVARELLWRCWTQPSLITQWFTPPPFRTVGAELDLRPGGSSVVTMQGPDGTHYPNRGVYLEVTPPNASSSRMRSPAHGCPRPSRS